MRESTGASNIASLTTFSSTFDYGKSTKKILYACRPFLEFEVMHMAYNPETMARDMSVFVDFPVDVVDFVPSSDNLNVSSEWTRCLLFEAFYDAVVSAYNRPEDNEDVGMAGSLNIIPISPLQSD